MFDELFSAGFGVGKSVSSARCPLRDLATHFQQITPLASDPTFLTSSPHSLHGIVLPDFSVNDMVSGLFWSLSYTYKGQRVFQRPLQLAGIQQSGRQEQEKPQLLEAPTVWIIRYYNNAFNFCRSAHISYSSISEK